MSAPEINISPVPDIVSGSRQFVPVTRNSCRSSVYDILLTFENESCRSHMKSCRTVTDDRRLFHALVCVYNIFWIKKLQFKSNLLARKKRKLFTAYYMVKF